MFTFVGGPPPVPGAEFGILIEIYSSDYSVLPFDPAGTVDQMHLDSRLHTTYVYVRKTTYGKKD